MVCERSMLFHLTGGGGRMGEGWGGGRSDMICMPVSGGNYDV